MPAGYNWRISDAKSLDTFPDRDLFFNRAGRSGGRGRHMGGDRLKRPARIFPKTDR